VTYSPTPRETALLELVRRPPLHLDPYHPGQTFVRYTRPPAASVNHLQSLPVPQHRLLEALPCLRPLPRAHASQHRI
jgi:hypothetical protein